MKVATKLEVSYLRREIEQFARAEDI